MKILLFGHVLQKKNILQGIHTDSFISNDVCCYWLDIACIQTRQGHRQCNLRKWYPMANVSLDESHYNAYSGGFSNPHCTFDFKGHFVPTIVQLPNAQKPLCDKRVAACWSTCTPSSQVKIVRNRNMIRICMGSLAIVQRDQKQRWKYIRIPFFESLFKFMVSN